MHASRGMQSSDNPSMSQLLLVLHTRCIVVLATQAVYGDRKQITAISLPTYTVVMATRSHLRNLQKLHAKQTHLEILDPITLTNKAGIKSIVSQLNSQSHKIHR